mgnify:FL=1
MVGIGTVLADNPMLNCRMQGGIDPVRIVCDTHLRIPMDCQIVQTADTIETILATSTNEKEKIDQLIKKGIQILQIPEKDGCIDLNLLMRTLGGKGIDSILLEGGGRLNDSFLREKLIQKAYVYLAPKIFGGEDAKTPVEGIGVSLPEQSANFKLQQIQQIEEDILLEYIAK